MTDVSLALVAATYRWRGVAPREGWLRSTALLLLMCTSMLVHETLARRLHLWMSMRDLSLVFGPNPGYLWVSTWMVLAMRPTQPVGPRDWLRRARATYREMKDASRQSRAQTP